MIKVKVVSLAIGFILCPMIFQLAFAGTTEKDIWSNVQILSPSEAANYGGKQCTGCSGNSKNPSCNFVDQPECNTRGIDDCNGMRKYGATGALMCSGTGVMTCYTIGDTPCYTAIMCVVKEYGCRVEGSGGPSYAPNQLCITGS